MNARTNVRATNWPTRSTSLLNSPRESRKGANVAPRRTYEDRRKSAVANKMEALLANAQRKFARIAQTHMNVAHMNAADRASDKIVGALQSRAIEIAKRNAQ
jgi:hypothetical protein